MITLLGIIIIEIHDRFIILSKDKAETQKSIDQIYSLNDIISKIIKNFEIIKDISDLEEERDSISNINYAWYYTNQKVYY